MEKLPDFTNVKVTLNDSAKYSQRSILGKVRLDFAFNGSILSMHVKDSTDEFTRNIDCVTVDFENVSRSTTQNTWFRNVGALWIILGIAQSYYNIFFILGVLMLIYFYVSQVKLLYIDASPIKVIIIEDKMAKTIIREIKERAEEALRSRLFVGIENNNEIVDKKGAVKFLLEKGAISKEEYDYKINVLNTTINYDHTDSVIDGLIKDGADTGKDHKVEFKVEGSEDGISLINVELINMGYVISQNDYGDQIELKAFKFLPLDKSKIKLEKNIITNLATKYNLQYNGLRIFRS